jgi:hypothetical protein
MRSVGKDDEWTPDYMTRKIILHCGAPKTGSTSFQHMLYANRDLLLKAGFYSPAVSRKKRAKDDIRILLSDVLRPENDNQVFLHRIRAVLGRLYAESGAHTLIISNEGMLGKPFNPRYTGFYPRAMETAERLALALEDHDIEVRFVVRDYPAFLASWYVQSVRMGSKYTLNNFLGSYDFSTVTWQTPVDALRKHFDPSKVGIFDHADLVKNPHAFLTAAFPEIMAALGERGRELPSKNPSIGAGMVDVYRRWNRIADRISWSSKSRRTIHHLGRRYGLLPLERFSNSEKVRLPTEMAANLSARYQIDLPLLDVRQVPEGEGSR